MAFAAPFLIGVVAGLRSFTAPAVVAWAAYLGWLKLNETFLSFIGSPIAVTVLSLFALGELVGDKLPKIPRRTAPAPLLVRIVTGGLCGACLTLSANESFVVGAALGAVGAVLGAFAGYEIRRRLVTKLGAKDRFVAVTEDVVAVGLALFLVLL